VLRPAFVVTVSTLGIACASDRGPFNPGMDAGTIDSTIDSGRPCPADPPSGPCPDPYRNCVYDTVPCVDGSTTPSYFRQCECDPDSRQWSCTPIPDAAIEVDVDAESVLACGPPPPTCADAGATSDCTTCAYACCPTEESACLADPACTAALQCMNACDDNCDRDLCVVDCVVAAKNAHLDAVLCCLRPTCGEKCLNVR
jgi:hypothetical protein